MQLLSIWHVDRSSKSDTLSYLLFRHRKMSVHIYSKFFALRSHGCSSFILRLWKMSEFWCKLLFRKNQFGLSCMYLCVFYLSFSVGSPAAESMFTVFHLGWTENDINHYSLPNPSGSCFINGYTSLVSLLLRICALAYSREDFRATTLGRTFFKWRRYCSINIV